VYFNCEGHSGGACGTGEADAIGCSETQLEDEIPKVEAPEFLVVSRAVFFHFQAIFHSFRRFRRFRQFSGVIFPLFVFFPVPGDGILARRKAC
jgi:hypothetical protein